MTCNALGAQQSLNNHLSGNASVVGTYLPQGILAFHALVSNQCVHDAFLKTMAHVQTAGDIGGRNHDAVWVTLAAGGEIAFLFPIFIPGLFD